MNFIKQAVQFFKEAYFELTKVTWLGKKEVAATTFIVVVFVIIMSVFVSFVDVIIARILGYIL